eukprot:6178377-Pleurochrysis_carterae.AAC.3
MAAAACVRAPLLLDQQLAQRYVRSRVRIAVQPRPQTRLRRARARTRTRRAHDTAVTRNASPVLHSSDTCILPRNSSLLRDKGFRNLN